jgi:ABC-type transport system involved in cytochrome c biogenesis permease subunit
MNRLSYLPTFLLALFLTGSLFGATPKPSAVFENIVIQDGGRLKPLDTFARNQLLAVHQKSTIDGQSAMDWLVDLMLHPDVHFNRLEFKIREPDVLDALGIEIHVESRYTFTSLKEGMSKVSEELYKWFQKEPDTRTPVETKVIRLYGVMAQYYQLSRGLSLFKRDISIDHSGLAKEFDLDAGEKVSYLHFLLYSDRLRTEVGALSQMEAGNRGEREKAMAMLVGDMSEKIQDELPPELAIMPPKIKGAEEWKSPWVLMGNRGPDEESLEKIKMLQEAVDHLAEGDVVKALEASARFREAVGYRTYIDLEVSKNKADLFYRSMYCYILALLLLLASWMIWPTGLRRAAFWIMNLGLAVHGAGIVLRMLIMGRPPVSTLYESIIFVGFIGVLICLVLEWVRRNGIGIFSGTTLGILLHFIGFSYAEDGDTLGMLVAVLDSNFWLATHVVTITMGYGVTVVAGVVGHLYLFMAILRPNDKKGLQEIYKNGVGLSLVALLFTTLGTILGGIWADQSWGRFWGWDPKENGALLIVLWLLMLLHGRISGLVKPLGFSAGLVLGNIIVALAWFGVNLLAVGLHNYGFTEAIAINLSIFCGIEAFLAFVGYLWASNKKAEVPENKEDPPSVGE